ncbi:MAG: GNAT family N-acetyltransferase [Proteobacteria bacterium]|nr:GNAT family N-acetyltransferase [Pseudomonadota bacterium]
MTALLLKDLPHYTDILRLRNGASLTVRFVQPCDTEALQNYFRGLTARSRYNRLLGATSELPLSVLSQFVRVGEGEGFSAVATMKLDGVETIVGEIRYAFDVAASRLEFGISITDRWQGFGIGAALLSNLECRAAALGATEITGDTLRSNDAMIRLARKSGYAFMPTPGDWKLVRFEKPIAIAKAEIPCASWRIAAQEAAMHAV